MKKSIEYQIGELIWKVKEEELKKPSTRSPTLPNAI